MTSVPLNLRIGRLELPRDILLDWAYTYIIRLLGLVRLHYQNLNSKSRLLIRQFFYTFRLIYNHLIQVQFQIYIYTSCHIHFNITRLMKLQVQFTLFIQLNIQRPNLLNYFTLAHLRINYFIPIQFN